VPDPISSASGREFTLKNDGWKAVMADLKVRSTTH
jgi:hypothetical protein